MNLSRSQKILIAVLGVGLGALAVDRLLLGGAATGPAQASAMPIPGAPAPDGTAHAGAGDSSAAAPATLSVAEQLRAVAAAEHLNGAVVPDAFEPSEQWVPAPAPADNRSAARQAESAADNFARSHPLSAVLTTPTGGWAMIAGQTVRVGQSVDGFTLVSVTEGAAVLERDGVRVELKLPLAGDLGVSRP